MSLGLLVSSVAFGRLAIERVFNRCQGIFLEVMASDKAIRESSRAWSCGWLSHRLAAAQHHASELSDDVNVRGEIPRVVSPPHVLPPSLEGI
ncbi:hypothetical protein TYRP_023337 [Tyrophagus putrescentiae]|nr:hypothetical protein TYRP_023337 [Tyrophagus putrescentiae]